MNGFRCCHQIVGDIGRKTRQPSSRKSLEQFASILQTHRDGLLSWYDCRISTAALEGTNTKVSVNEGSVARMTLADHPN